MNPLSDVKNFSAWWAEGLALALPRRWRERQLALKQFLLVHVDEDALLFERCSSGSSDAANRISLPSSGDWDPARARIWLDRDPTLSTLPIILRVPKRKVLLKQLRYPMASEADLRNIISFEIERQTPFAKQDVYFDYIQLESTQSEAHVEVELIVLPKRDVSDVLKHLVELNLGISAIDVDDPRFLDAHVNLLPDAEARHGSRPNYSLRFGLCLLWLGLIALIPARLAYETGREVEQLVIQERAALTRVKNLNALRAEHARLGKKRNFLDQLDAEYTSSLILLSELTETLGDDTWIQRFELKNGLVTLQGESSNASELPRLLEASNRFSAPRFSSPVTRNTTSGLDRFKLVLTVDSDRSS